MSLPSLPEAQTETAPLRPTSVIARLMETLLPTPPHELLMTRMSAPASMALET